MNYLADYFVVIGAKEDRHQDLDSNGSTEGEAKYVGVITDRFPETDYPQNPLPPHIWMFCFPEGIKPTFTPPSPTYSVNVLTQMDGTRSYIASLMFYEAAHPSLKANVKNLSDKLKKKLSGSTLSSEHPASSFILSNSPVYFPKCICVISRHPFFSTFKDFLSNIYFTIQGSSKIPIERYISNFIMEASFPAAGNVNLQVSTATDKITCSIPSTKELDLVDFSYKYLFDSLDIDNVLRLVECILSEKKVLFTTSSSNYLLLTYVAEAILALIYPFYWPYVYVPVMPTNLVTFLEAPTPFILGICRTSEEIEEAMKSLEDVVIVDLDRNRVKGVDPNVPYLPHRNQLFFIIRNAIHPELCNAGLIIQEHRQKDAFTTVRRALLECFAQLLSEWRTYLPVEADRLPVSPRGSLTSSNSELPPFNKQEFLNTLQKDNLRFMQSFINTYIFDLFVEEHYKENPLNLFDDTILKLHRTPTSMIDKMKSSSEKLLGIDKSLKMSTDKFGVALTLVTKPSMDGINSESSFNYNSMFPKLNALYFMPKDRTISSDDKSSPSSSSRRRAAQGFDYEVLVKAASGDLPDEVDVAVFFMQGLVHKLFKGYSLDILEIAQVCELLKQDYGRNHFALMLVEEKVKRATGILSMVAFEMLANLVDTALAEAENKNDFVTAKLLMLVGSQFSMKKDNGSEEFIRARLKQRTIWQNIEFWEYVLQDDLKSHLSSEEDPPETFGPSKRDDTHKQNEISNVVFGLIVNIAYSMVNFALPGKLIMSFVHKMSEHYHLSDEQCNTLNSMIDKMCNFYVDSPAEVRRTSTVQPPTPQPAQPTTPTKSSILRNKIERKAKQVKQMIEKKAGSNKDKDSLHLPLPVGQ